MPKYVSDTIIQLDDRTIAPGEDFELADDHPLVKSGRVVIAGAKKAAAKSAAGSSEAPA